MNLGLAEDLLIYKSGVLLKKQQVRGGWPARLFEIDGVRLNYKYPKSTLCRTYKLCDGCSVEKCTMSGKPSLRLIIARNGKVDETMLLRPPCTDGHRIGEVERDSWFKALTHAIRHAKHGLTGTIGSESRPSTRPHSRAQSRKNSFDSDDEDTHSEVEHAALVSAAVNAALEIALLEKEAEHNLAMHLEKKHRREVQAMHDEAMARLKQEHRDFVAELRAQHDRELRAAGAAGGGGAHPALRGDQTAECASPSVPARGAFATSPAGSATPPARPPPQQAPGSEQAAVLNSARKLGRSAALQERQLGAAFERQEALGILEQYERALALYMRFAVGGNGGGEAGAAAATGAGAGSGGRAGMEATAGAGSTLYHIALLLKNKLGRPDDALLRYEQALSERLS
jgi:hypothetical protein